MSFSRIAGEAVAAMLADALGETRIVGRELQVVARHRDDLGYLVHRQRPGQHADAAAGHAELARHEVAQFRRHLAVEFDADHRAAAAALQRRLEQPDQILGLFLDLDIAVADDAERAGALDLVTREQLADEQADRLLDRDEAHIRLAVGQPDEAPQRRRQAQQRRHALAVLEVAQLQGDREAEIGNERKRMRRIDRQRGQNREYLLEEMIFEPGNLVLGELVGGDALDALLAQQREEVGQAVLLVLLQPADFEQESAPVAARGVRPSGLRSTMPSRTWPARPATRTMKNSSRLAAEMDRKRTRSSSGWQEFCDSSSTRRLNCSQENSRLTKRSGFPETPPLSAVATAVNSLWAGFNSLISSFVPGLAYP